VTRQLCKSCAGFPDEKGDCKCDLWYTGPDCSLALCLNNCSDHGACDSNTGTCWCDPGWAAADCSKKLCANNCTGHGICFEGQCSCQDGFSGADCGIWPCPNSCSGNGACFNGTCACDNLWDGGDCSIFTGYLLECPGNCTGRGTCTNSSCHCDPGWSGLDCAAPISCLGNCTGHGMCYNASCTCDLGFSGADCSAAHCLNNCSLHGACTPNGTCACDPFFHGADCSLRDLTCGTGFHGNCSGHGSCIDAAVNQWWSGSSRLPDMWAWEEPSRHLVRRDVASYGDFYVGRCTTDFYGIPTTVENQASMAVAEHERVLLSNGVPDHFIIDNGFPLCEVTWSISVPLDPLLSVGPCEYEWPLPRDALCSKPHALPLDSPVAYALNGIPIWGPLLSDGSNAVEGPEAVPCYGHASRGGMWHYHHPLVGCNVAANQETLLAYALDGFPIYGPLSGSKDEVDALLDKCNGRALEDGTYRYHVRSLAQVDESLPYSAEDLDPRNPMDIPVHTNWNYVLGCYSGKPVTSLGLRQVISPLRTLSDGWMSPQSNAAMTTDSIAAQLGLTSRIGICMCDLGWVGTDCRTMGCLNNCSAHGFCEANETFAQCHCEHMWEGSDCSRRVNTTCDVGCSGHGTCLWESHPNASCLCDLQWEGSNCQSLIGPPCPYNCSGHGSCFNRTCICDHMFDGEGCQHPSAYAMNLNATLCWQWIGHILTNNSCSGRGTCFNGTCLCDAGWLGVNCSTPFVPDPVYIDCPRNCSFHGSCAFTFDPLHVTYNGTCMCDVGYAGPDCSIDWGAQQCDGNCSAHGSCVNKTCICDPGWTGFDCNEKWISPIRLCPMNCSDHGSCFNGTCTCDLGWHGVNCSLPDPCPGDCSGHGVCVLGNCTCDPEWAGSDCSHTSYCPGFVSHRGVNCSGHGICVDGACLCEAHWGGFDCSIEACINSCSNNGLCRNGTCDCFIGFIGDDCSMGPYGGECPNACSGHGACTIVSEVFLPAEIADVHGDGMLSGSIGCMCDEGWEGVDCTLRSCPNDCSGNGACAQNGSCYCYHNWAGADCSTAWCPNNCHNHGTCVGGQGCLCDIGYDGLDCGTSACPGNCTGRGVCVRSPGLTYTGDMYENDAEKGYETNINNTFSTCMCFYGWGGDDCSTMSCPLNCSFPNGQCFNGTCVCNMLQGYYGRNCSEQFGLVELRTDGRALVPSYGIFEGGTIVTVRGSGFVNSDTMRCKFGSKLVVADLVQPNPPEVPYATCFSPGEANPRDVFFQFSLDNRYWTQQDARIKFTYHGNGIVTGLRWPTAPEQGGTTVTFFGINFQFALGVKCKFGVYEILGSFNVRFIEDPVTGELEQEAQLLCPVPPLKDLNLAESEGNTVILWVSMNMGQNWMRYEADYFFSYYGLTRISPSFGPQQDQKTEVAMYGFNFYQGAGRQDLFPGFAYQYTCIYRVPWVDEGVEVKALSSTWTLVTAPPDGTRFSCEVPPGLVGEGGYTGPVEVGISINPCIKDPSGSAVDLGCLDSLPYTTEPILFYYVENTVDKLSKTLGPVSGGTIVTITGNGFNRRDLTDLPRPYSHPVILCKWGTEINQGVYNVNDQSVVCVSPRCQTASCTQLLLTDCPVCTAPVKLEVALNGQDFTNSQVDFFYFKDPQVQKIQPTLGSVEGGTLVTVEAQGFHDPCEGCMERQDCAACGDLIVCKFQAFNRVEHRRGECVRNAEGACNPNKILCPSPMAKSLRGNIVSLDPFYVALSVSLNNQNFFPMNPEDNEPYNVYHPPCLGSRTTGCAFLFKFYEIPQLISVFPTAIPGNGGGRITISGRNLLNENGLSCRFGRMLGPQACVSGATGDFTAVASPEMCIGALPASPIFISSDLVICGTVNLQPVDGSRPLSSSVGLSFNGGKGEFDTYWLRDSSNDILDTALKVYWVLSIQPSLGFKAGQTRVTITGLNFEAVGEAGDNTNMRCRFGDTVVFPDPKLTVDPVTYDIVSGTIQCTSPPNTASSDQEQVILGICLSGIHCEYTGKARQAEATDTYMPDVDHFTKSSSYYFYKAPQLSTLTPSLGPILGSTLVTVAGVGFFDSPYLKCRFDDGRFSLSSTFIDSSSVVCETPPLTTSSYSLDITLNNQDYSAGCADIDPDTGLAGSCFYYFYTEPVITAVAPQAGINTGSSLVVLTIQNPIINFYQLRCRFKAVHAPDAERLQVEGFDMVTDARTEASAPGTVSCFSPTSQPAAADVAPILHTATSELPKRGLTYVSLTWNGQQFGPYDEQVNTQRFWFHDEVEVISLVPSGGQKDNAQLVTLYGESFVDVPSLVVQFGENKYLCSVGAATSSCPEDSNTHVRDAVSFINSKELQFRVPISQVPGVRTVRVSNNGLPQEFSTATVQYVYYSSTDQCPEDCRGIAPDSADPHGTCQDVTPGGDRHCVCNLGYSGLDCSVGPIVMELKPSSGLVTGGWQVTVIGRNIWNYNTIATSGKTFKARIDNRISVLAERVAGCTPLPGGGGGEACQDKLVFNVPTQDMYVSVNGVPVEITVNGKDYTVNNRRLQLFGRPTISGLLPDGAHYSGNVVVTVTGTNFVDTGSIRVALGPFNTEPQCLSELCLRAVYVSPSKMIFTTDPCRDSCHFRASLPMRLAINGVNFIETTKTLRFLKDTAIARMVPNVGSTNGGTPVEITATNMNVTTGFKCKFGDQEVAGSMMQDTGKLLCKSPAFPLNVTVPVSIALDGQTFSNTPDCAAEAHKCFVYTTPLLISRVFPSLGPMNGGTPITIEGRGFYAVAGVQGRCKFTAPDKSTLTTTMTMVDPSHFTCLSPATPGVDDTPDTYQFQLAGNGVDFEAFPFDYISYKNPTLIAGTNAAVNPIGAPIIGGTKVTLSGIGFINSQDGIRVRFLASQTNADGVVSVVSSFVSDKASFLSDTQVVIVTRRYPYAAGLTKVSVSLNNGLDYSDPAAQDFQFYETPILTEIQPPLGPRLGETSVAVLGSGFIKLRDVAKCRFGDMTVPAIFDDEDVQSGIVFRCKSPPWSIPGWVSVEIAMDGQVFTNSKVVKFRYYGEIDIFSVLPAGGPKAGGTEVTVTGVGMFMSGKYLSCFFGEGDYECRNGLSYPCYRAVEAQFRTPTTVTCVSPAMPQGGSVTQAYPIRVGLNAQYSQACPNTKTSYQCPLKPGLAFTYYDDVFITGISPNSGQVQGGTELTVYGSGFRPDLDARTRCLFTRCTSADIFTSGDNFGKFRNEAKPRCTGETIYSPLAKGAVGVISTTMIRCMSPLASSADSHFTLFDISLNRGVTNQNLYGPLCQNGCPVTYFYYALPSISINTPSLGPNVGSTVVTINGVGFIGFQNTQIRCKFGTVESTATSTGVVDAVKYLSDTSISCIAPPQEEATVRVSVSLNGLDSDFTLPELGAPYRYHEPPKVTGVPKPSAGPTSGRTIITIFGTGFLDGNLQCKFWTAASKGSLNLVVRADFMTTSTVSCVSPAVTQSQLVKLSVSLNGQDFSPFFYDDLYYYFPAPVIHQLYPRGGPAQSGGFALVRGENFLDTPQLLCRVGVVITQGQFINNTFVRCKIPQIQRKIYSKVVEDLGILPETLADDFAVYPVEDYPVEMSFDGQTFSRSGVMYTYYTTPQVDQIVPNRGAKGKLTTVAILNGANFRNDLGGPFCRFAGLGATRAVFMTDRSIRCQVPAVPFGKTVLVEISNNGQEYEDHASATFSFMGEAPVLQSAFLSPSFDAISLQFDVDTDRGGGEKGSFECGRIIQLRHADLSLPSSGLSAEQLQALGASPSDPAIFTALFGYGVKCRFENNRTAAIVMGAFPNFRLGHPIWLKENRFRRGIELTYYAAGNASITSPFSASKPVALLAGPSEIGRCDNLEIDAAPSSGGLGRSLYYSWILDVGRSKITDDNLDASQKTGAFEKLGGAVAAFSGAASVCERLVGRYLNSRF